MPPASPTAEELQMLEAYRAVRDARAQVVAAEQAETQAKEQREQAQAQLNAARAEFTRRFGKVD